MSKKAMLAAGLLISLAWLIAEIWGQLHPYRTIAALLIWAAFYTALARTR